MLLERKIVRCRHNRGQRPLPPPSVCALFPSSSLPPPPPLPVVVYTLRVARADDRRPRDPGTVICLRRRITSLARCTALVTAAGAAHTSRQRDGRHSCVLPIFHVPYNAQRRTDRPTCTTTTVVRKIRRYSGERGSNDYERTITPRVGEWRQKR